MRAQDKALQRNAFEQSSVLKRCTALSQVFNSALIADMKLRSGIFTINSTAPVTRNLPKREPQR